MRMVLEDFNLFWWWKSKCHLVPATIVIIALLQPCNLSTTLASKIITPHGEVPEDGHQALLLVMTIASPGYTDPSDTINSTIDRTALLGRDGFINCHSAPSPFHAIRVEEIRFKEATRTLQTVGWISICPTLGDS